MPDPSADAELDSLLCFAIYSAGLAFGRMYRPLLESAGLTYVQYVVLVALWSRDDRTVGDLCETLFLTTSTMTPVLQKLEGKGLIRRSRGYDDERRVHVLLTAAGDELRTMAEPVQRCIQEAAGLDGSALHELRVTVSALRDRLLSGDALERQGPQPAPSGGRRMPKAARRAAGRSVSR